MPYSHRRNPHILCMAIVAALFGPDLAVAASGQVLADDTTVMLAPDDYSTAAANEHALWATHGGQILKTDPAPTVNVLTTGTRARAAFAETGSTIILRGVNVTTQGANAVALEARHAGSRIEFTGGAVTTQSLNSVAAQDGGLVQLNRATVSGWLTADDAGRIEANDTTVKAGSVVATETGSTVALTRSTISEGGLLAYDGGVIEVVDSTINATRSIEEGQGAVNVEGSGRVRITGSKINVTGNDDGLSAGVAVFNGGDAQIRSSQIAVSLATGEGAAVILDGNRSENRTSSATFVGTSIELTGRGSTAGVYINDSDLTLDGGSLKTTGTEAVLVLYRPENEPATRATLNFRNGASVTGGNGRLLSVGSERSATTVSLDSGATALGDIRFSTDPLIARGDTNGDGVLTRNVAVDLRGGAHWQGASDAVSALTVAGGSRWTVTGDSTVSRLSVDNGTVAFAQPSGGRFSTLTVAGDYTGNNGTLALNTALGGDNSATDRLVVTGATSGATTLTVANAGGAGEATSAGIRVVQVDGASSGSFSLGGRAVAGAYEYLLHKGSAGAAADGHWYLRSQALPTEPGPNPPGPNPPGPNPPGPNPPGPNPPGPNPPGPNPPGPNPPGPNPPGPNPPNPEPIFRAETGAYLANQAAALAMFRHSLHDRGGNLGADGDGRRGWSRVVRSQIDGRAGYDQLDTASDSSLLQIGTELGSWNEGRLRVGVMGGAGRAQSRVASSVVGYRAKGKIDGHGVGAYVTWLPSDDAPGLYLDGSVQYASFDHSVVGDGLAEERYRSKNWTASLEAGRAFALSRGEVEVYLEPQAQLVYTDYSSSDHREANGTVVASRDGGGLGGRVGLRLYGHASAPSANRVAPFVAVNWWHDGDRNAIAFDQRRVELRLPRDRYELLAGAQLRLGEAWSAWGQIAYRSGDHDYRDIGGQIGLGYRW